MKTTLFLLALAAALPLRGADLRETTRFPTSDRQSLGIEVTAEPIFPHHLVARGVTEGQVRILISVSHLGALSDWLVIAYTDKAFAHAVLDVLERWKFEPMLVRGQPVPCRVELRVAFKATGAVVTLDISETPGRLFSRPEEFVYAPCGLRELDRIPTPVLADSPAFPMALRETGVHGSATVEFFIDEQGTVRMPAVLAADHEELGFLAIEAVREWRFDAPTRRGVPVLARVRQTFRFRSDEGTS